MTRLPYQEELQRLKAAVTEELDVVARQLALVIEALESGDEAAAHAAISEHLRITQQLFLQA